MKNNKVEEVQWWLGDLFMLLCENKETVDPKIYNSIMDLKNSLVNSVTTVLFFHTKFKNQKELEIQTNNLLMLLDKQIADLELYLQLLK